MSNGSILFKNISSRICFSLRHPLLLWGHQRLASWPHGKRKATPGKRQRLFKKISNMSWRKDPKKNSQLGQGPNWTKFFELMLTKQMMLLACVLTNLNTYSLPINLRMQNVVSRCCWDEILLLVDAGFEYKQFLGDPICYSQMVPTWT